MIPSGFSKSTTTVIGNAVGAENVALCNQYYKTSLVIITAMTSVTALLLWVLKNPIIGIFTT